MNFGSANILVVLGEGYLRTVKASLSVIYEVVLGHCNTIFRASPRVLYLSSPSLFFRKRQKKHSPIVSHLLTISKLGSLCVKIRTPRGSQSPSLTTFLAEFFLWGHKLLIFRTKNKKLLEIDFFSSSYLFWELANNKIL